MSVTRFLRFQYAVADLSLVQAGVKLQARVGQAR